ncbi:hypothetical protein SeMB42_g06437 [Synchytrium endobioticum]|uniref:Far11/STRP C-terminal domain-containing protein n=1 Tax=Synchytrium endobioticum TaxID=286115 RepID=A0A507CHX4_9FUNG|nr:hypothetical protein SeMB42_g06437 [Synchytrium endobioticum]
MMNYSKPLSLPPPQASAPRPVYTTLSNAHQIQPPPLPPTPPPFLNNSPSNAPAAVDPDGLLNTDKVPWNALPPPPSMQDSSGANAAGSFSMAAVRRALASKQRVIHYKFVYADRDDFVREINEFMHHQDFSFLRQGQDLFEKDFAPKQWFDSAISQKSTYIQSQLELLELKNPTERAHACRKLLYIAAGVFGELPSDATSQDHVKVIKSNNELLLHAGTVSYISQALRVISTAMDAASRSGNPGLPIADRQVVINLANVEVSVCLSILYFVVEVNMGHERLAMELGEGDIPVAGHLFVLVSQLSDSNRKHYPAKKLLLLLWKVLMASLGDSERLLQLKNTARALEGLPPLSLDDPFMKAAPADYQQLHTALSNRYPAYVLPDTRIMATSTAIEDLPLTSYPSPSPRPIPWEQPAPLQPFISSDPNSNPSYIDEAVSTFKRYAFVSLGSVQYAREIASRDRKDAMMHAFATPNPVDGAAAWTPSSRVNGHDYNTTTNFIGSSSLHAVIKYDSNKTPGGESSRHDQNTDTLERMDRLYKYLLPNLSIHTVMLVRLLYYVNLDGKLTPDGDAPHGSSTDGQNQASENSSGKSTLESADATRHREVVTKAVSGVLLLLLKAAKCRNIFMFEYISQLLLDHNCAILILKMLSTWFQNANVNSVGAAFLKEKVEPPQLNFFCFCRNLDDVTDNLGKKNEEGTTSSTNNIADVIDGYDSRTAEAEKEEDMPEINPGSWRNFFTAINLLRVLQKFSKRKSHRILSLVHWKASAVLKRVVKIGHVGLQLYALKLLKGQIPYSGRKWRSGNMKVITSIYLHLRPSLRDEYLTGDIEVDADEALLQEQQLRALIASYHRRVYRGILNGPPSDSNNIQTKHLSTDSQDDLDLVLMLHEAGSKSLPCIRATDLAAYRATSQHLDENFIQNYEVWLQNEVYDEGNGGNGVHEYYSVSGVESDDELDLWGIREMKKIEQDHSPDGIFRSRPHGFEDLPPAYQEEGYGNSGWDGGGASDPLDDEHAAGNFSHAAPTSNVDKVYSRIVAYDASFHRF